MHFQCPQIARVAQKLLTARGELLAKQLFVRFERLYTKLLEYFLYIKQLLSTPTI